ncbi:hypothetical protein [Salibacterium sp. K-3]
MKPNKTLPAGIIVIVAGIFLLNPYALFGENNQQAGNAMENSDETNSSADTIDEETSQNTVLLPNEKDLPEGIDKNELEKETLNNVTLYFQSTESPKIADRYYFIYRDAMFNVGGTNVEKGELKDVVRSILQK